MLAGRAAICAPPEHPTIHVPAVHVLCRPELTSAVLHFSPSSLCLRRRACEQGPLAVIFMINAVKEVLFLSFLLPLSVPIARSHLNSSCARRLKHGFSSRAAVLLLCAIRAIEQGYDDRERAKSDKRANERPVRVVRNGELVRVRAGLVLSASCAVCRGAAFWRGLSAAMPCCARATRPTAVLRRTRVLLNPFVGFRTTL